MAIFDRFKRKDQSVLPEEVKQYYQSEQRQRAGVAVLLGIAAIIITVLIAVGLFYGGRYVYRQINKEDNQITSQEGETNKPQNEAAPAKNPNATPGSDTTDSSVDQPTRTTTTPSPSSPSATNSPDLGDEAPLPRTGDPGM